MFEIFFPTLSPLSILMMALVLFVTLCVGFFSIRYMAGDRRYKTFFLQFIGLGASAMAMVATDHIIVLLIAFMLSNFFLITLMIHKASWQAAKNTGIIAGKYHLVGGLILGISLALLALEAESLSISHINAYPTAATTTVSIALFLLVITALIQSGIWPFHRWLLSSLNSPTPVSAVMHAALINGGGFLMTLFAPLYLQTPWILNLLLMAGLITAVVGTVWKLIQSDVKRMLACSTLAQMGFMIMQCGMGLFPAAIAHLIWHGLFKAHLFLGSGGAAQVQRHPNLYPPRFFAFLYALLCGLGGSYVFAQGSNHQWMASNSTAVLLTVVFLASTQLALTIVQTASWRQWLVAPIIVGVSSFIYGKSIHLITAFMAPMDIMKPQPLNVFHIICISALCLAWLSMIFLKTASNTKQMPKLFQKFYVRALNASQAAPVTITPQRNQYNYL